MPSDKTLITWLKDRFLNHRHTGGEGAQVAHSALSGLTTGDDHTQYRLESADHNHQSTGAEAGKLDHGAALTGLGDNDHTQYLLVADTGTLLDSIVTFQGQVVVHEGKVVYT
jgi:hypothetical protein